VSRFQFVADHRHAFEVKWLCAVMDIARSSFYAWLAAAEGRAARQAADQALAERIRTVHTADTAYGAPRITAELNDGVSAVERVNHKRVARVMQAAGIAGYRRKRRVKTTTPDPGNQKVPDLFGRDFTATTTNTKYVGDITFLPLADGVNLYLATVIDCYSRRVAGWAIAPHMRTELVEDALKAACALRGGLAGARFHSDHGSQGGFQRWSQHLDDGGVWWRRERRSRRPARPKNWPAAGGSGRRIGHCGQRCAHPGVLSRPGRFSVRSGA
jgi:transposase InsO family protein